MDGELFVDIKTYLRLEKTMSEQERDRFLQDFSAPFRHATSEWSVPASWEREYRLLLEKQERKAYRYNWGGTMTRDENGTVTIRYGPATLVIPGNVWNIFLQDAFSQNPGPHAGGDLGVANPGQSSAPINIGNTHIENDDRPARQEQMKRTMDELKKFGQQAYPRHS